VVADIAEDGSSAAVERLREGGGEAVGVGALREMLWLLGLEGLLERRDEAPDEVRRLAAEREEARAAGDFGAADGKRDALASLGWEVRDTPDGPQLVRSR
jgi:cysteinyl-tRNA synthetase